MRNGLLGKLPIDAYRAVMPAVNRIFVRFRDRNGVTRGSTNVAMGTRQQPHASRRPPASSAVVKRFGHLSILPSAAPRWTSAARQENGKRKDGTLR